MIKIGYDSAILLLKKTIEFIGATWIVKEREFLEVI